MINNLLEDIEGKLTSSKWSKMCKCSQITAGRAIQYLISKNILVQEAGGVRSSSYVLAKV
jgi:Fic family protein